MIIKVLIKVFDKSAFVLLSEKFFILRHREEIFVAKKFLNFFEIFFPERGNSSVEKQKKSVESLAGRKKSLSTREKFLAAGIIARDFSRCRCIS